MRNVLSLHGRQQACSVCVLTLVNRSGGLVSRRRTDRCEPCNMQAGSPG